jgi:GAF domain-containing protein
MVLNDLVRYGETEVAAALLELAARIQALVPELVGMSVGQTQSGYVFTLAASSAEAAGIDASQYIDGGPCVEASAEGKLESWALPTDPAALLDEERWALYARASAAEGVASSLSLPLVLNGQAVGGVNLYASTPDAFDGHHEALADVLGTEVTLAVANADLAFATRSAAERTGQQYTEELHVHVAVGIIAERQQVDTATARRRLAAAAQRAGITEVQAAKALIKPLGH